MEYISRRLRKAGIAFVALLCLIAAISGWHAVFDEKIEVPAPFAVQGGEVFSGDGIGFVIPQGCTANVNY